LLLFGIASLLKHNQNLSLSEISNLGKIYITILKLDSEFLYVFRHMILSLFGPFYLYEAKNSILPYYSAGWRRTDPGYTECQLWSNQQL